MIRAISVLTISLAMTVLSYAQSNTCHLEYNSASAHCIKIKQMTEKLNGYSAAADFFDDCLNKAAEKQTCCNMQSVVDSKNATSEKKGWHIVWSGSKCTAIANRNEKPLCSSCEAECKVKMNEVSGLASTCKSLCAKKYPLQCGE